LPGEDKAWIEGKHCKLPNTIRNDTSRDKSLGVLGLPFEGIIFQWSQRSIFAVEEAEKLVTGWLGEYDDRLVFVRGLNINTTMFLILDVKERRRNAIVE
jgi:hypothetical protein